MVVDTSWFKGNYPPHISVEAAAVEGVVSVDQLLNDVEWVTIVDKSPAEGDTRNPFKVDAKNRFTHVRLTMHPDGGVARLCQAVAENWQNRKASGAASTGP